MENNRRAGDTSVSNSPAKPRYGGWVTRQSSEVAHFEGGCLGPRRDWLQNPCWTTWATRSLFRWVKSIEIEGQSSPHGVDFNFLRRPLSRSIIGDNVAQQTVRGGMEIPCRCKLPGMLRGFGRRQT